MDYYKKQESKVAWAGAVEEFVRHPVYKRLEQEMLKEVVKLEKLLRKGTGSLVEDDRIRARLDVWDKWDKLPKSWVGLKEKALSELAERKKEG